MDDDEDDPEREAVDWVLRLATADGAGWACFMEWLERDRRNPIAYDRVSVIGDGLAHRAEPDGATPAVRSPVKPIR